MSSMSDCKNIIIVQFSDGRCSVSQTEGENG